MTDSVPRSIQEYLGRLRAELAGADPALIQVSAAMIKVP